MPNKIYDCIIIGGGPAGLCASVYLKRANIDVIIIEKGPFGGKVNYTSIVNNYLGLNNSFGPDLAEKFYQHALDNDVEIVGEEVTNVTKKDVFKLETLDNCYYAKTIIVATGTKDKKLGVDDEIKYEHRGISYCAVCDGPMYKNKNVAVIGGGNSALEEALYLSKIANKVYLIHRRNEFRADDILVDKIKETKNIELVLKNEVKKLLGENNLEKVVLKDDKELKVSALFPYIGQIPHTDFLKSLNVCNDSGYVIVNSNMETSLAGLFAAGDVTNKDLKQIIVASGDGAIAAHSVIKFLRG